MSDKHITHEQIQALESLLYRTIQYGKLCGTEYFNHLDMGKYREYIYDTYSAETIWSDIDTPTVIKQIQRNDSDKEYGTYGRYEVDSRKQGKVRDFKQWVKMEAGEIATNGIVGFIRNLDKLGNIVSGWMRNLKVAWKLRKINPAYVETQFKNIKTNIERRDELRGSIGENAVKVYGPDLSLLAKRLEGFVNICDTIHNIAENSDEDAFDSDKTWEAFAQQSNRALKTVPPKEGMFFRELKRIEPYVHTFDCTKSEWNDASALMSFAKKVCEIKETVTTKIKDDIKFIKKITDGLRSEVSHVKIKDGDVGGAISDHVGEKSVGAYTVGKGVDKDKVDEIVVEYARGYVASKFILQLQDMFATEALYIVETVPKLFVPPKDKNRDERVRNKAQNLRDVSEIEEKKKKEYEQKQNDNQG